VSELRRLGDPSSPITDDGLTAAYPWPDSGRWVRAMMVTTLDGAAAGADGLSGSVSSDADMRVFGSVRRFADAVLVGAQTMRAERYTPMRTQPARAEARAANGQSAAPVIVVVSRSLDLPWDLPVWSESTHRPVVVTGTDADPDRLREAREHADVVALPEVSPAAILDAVVDRGLRRIVCEGGPRLLAELTAAGLVDELDITIAPLMAGTSETPVTPVLEEAARFEPVHVLEGDGFLMTRYVRAVR